MKHKLNTLLEQLNHGLVEREGALKAALLTVLAGENLLLIGPPGTGKSLIARRLAESLRHDGDSSTGHGCFEYLLTKFSTPEEIFGPLSITELKADRFKRNTAGYLPTVHIAFLDEIFKASSSILNALLTILNERVYHNGAERQAVPLQALIAASNELPSEQEELSALYDRFLVRVFVDYVSQDNLLRLFDKTGDMPALTPLTLSDLHDIRRAAEAVTLPPEIIQAIQRIWAQHKDAFKEDRREGLSDRRLKKLIKLLSVSAASNGRDKVDLSDVLLLKDCLWNHPDNAVKVREMVFSALRAFSRQVPQDHGAEEVWADQPQANAGATPKIKGYKGSGTAHDLLLIENIHDLAGLVRPEVGQQGYYFKQTADIDCSEVSTWPDIYFTGHYNGNGHTIKDTNSSRAIFSHIGEKSSISNLILDNFQLTKSAENTFISYLTSSSILIKNDATNCKIQDCLILNGCISPKLLSKTSIERCFFYGSPQISHDRRDYVTIAYDCQGSTVKNCAIGIQGDEFYYGRPIVNNLGLDTILERNISVDSNSLRPSSNFKSDPNGIYAQALASALFTQHYFEHTLGWDFDTVWQWDAANNRPTLRAISSGAAGLTPNHTATTGHTTDLLTRQIRANLWL